MIKKILLIILILLITNLNTIFAVENPRWVSMPIYVYVPQYGNYTKLMKAAFNQWETQSDKLVRFEFVGRPEDANINVKFVREVKNCNSDNAVGCSRMITRSGRYYKNQLDIALMKKFDQNSFRPINNIYGVMRNNERKKGLLYKTNEYYEARELEIKDASSGSSDCFVSDACFGGNDFAEASPS